jgi:alpha-1,6-mannosyltransferase
VVGHEEHDVARDRRAATLVACVSAATLALFLLDRAFRHGRDAPTPQCLLGVALLAFAALFVRARWRAALDVRVVLGLSAVVIAIAVVTTPSSTDLWYYQMYGRIVVHYHDSPYKHTPGEYAGDPVLTRTGGVWDETRADYGPVFMAVAIPVAAVTGTNRRAARLAWQSLCGLAVFLALLLIARETGRGAAVALVGLNPVMVYKVVNGPHNDALIGLFILIAALLAVREHEVLAALACTAAALVKAPTGLALIALVAWTVVHLGAVRAGRQVVVAVATALALTAVAGGRAVVTPMLSARDRVSQLAPWNLLRRNAFELFAGRLPHVGPLPAAVPTLAVLLALACAALFVAAYVGSHEVALPISMALAAWLLVSLYPEPWTAAWVLPVVALPRRALVTPVVAVVAGVRTFAADWASTLYRFVFRPGWFPFAQHVDAWLLAASMSIAIGGTLLLVGDAVVRLRRTPAVYGSRV